MTMSPGTRRPTLPTLPQGLAVATYDTYAEAQKAVDYLSDKEFTVQAVTIVGTDLRMVERVTGRITYARVAMAGLASGAWFGLFVGLLLTFFSPTGSLQPIFTAVAIGAGFGILFQVSTYALSSGKRDFTSSSQIVAQHYSLLCLAENAGQARNLLSAPGGPGLGRATNPFAAAPVPPTSPAAQAPASPAADGPDPDSPEA